MKSDELRKTADRLVELMNAPFDPLDLHRFENLEYVKEKLKPLAEAILNPKQ